MTLPASTHNPRMEKCSNPDNLSSPLLKARKRQGLVTKRKLQFFLLVSPFILLLAFFCFVRGLLRNDPGPPVVTEGSSGASDWPSGSPDPLTHNLVGPSSQTLALNLRTIESIQIRSLTALLPVTRQSLSHSELIISSFLQSPAQLHEIIISCPEEILSDIRQLVRKVLSTTEGHDLPEISLHPWVHETDSNAALLRVAAEATTDWILFLDINGLDGIDVSTQDMLLNPLAIPLPTGPRGATFLSTNISCLTPSEIPQSASFLIPPFVMPFFLLPTEGAATGSSGTWTDLGGYISRRGLDAIGGVVMGSELLSNWCSVAQADMNPRNYTLSVPELRFASEMVNSDIPSEMSYNISPNLQVTRKRRSSFALVFPSVQDIRLFSPVVCRLQDNEHDVYVLVYLNGDYAEDTFDEPMEQGTIASGGCLLNYDTISLDHVPIPPSSSFTKPFVSDWLDTLDQSPDVVIALHEQEPLLGISRALERSQLSARPSLVLIPYVDLPYCEWMGSLSADEWRSRDLLYFHQL